MKTCCERVKTEKLIMWNSYNEVVQCHGCGHVYTKASNLKYKLNRVFRWW